MTADDVDLPCKGAGGLHADPQSIGGERRRRGAEQQQCNEKLAYSSHFLGNPSRFYVANIPKMGFLGVVHPRWMLSSQHQVGWRARAWRLAALVPADRSCRSRSRPEDPNRNMPATEHSHVFEISRAS